MEDGTPRKRNGARNMPHGQLPWAVPCHGPWLFAWRRDSGLRRRGKAVGCGAAGGGGGGGKGGVRLRAARGRTPRPMPYAVVVRRALICPCRFAIPSNFHFIRWLKVSATSLRRASGRRCAAPAVARQFAAYRQLCAVSPRAIIVGAFARPRVTSYDMELWMTTTLANKSATGPGKGEMRATSGHRRRACPTVQSRSLF